MIRNQKTFKNEEEASVYVKELGSLYRQVVVYIICNALFVLYWLFSEETYFWPIWVIIGWGLPLFFAAANLRALPPSIQKIMNSLIEALPFSFLKPGWESEQVTHLLKRGKSHKEEGSSLPSLKKVAVKMATNSTVKKALLPEEKVHKTSTKKHISVKKVASKKVKSSKTPKK